MIRKKIEKGLFLSIGLAAAAKRLADKHINGLIKEGRIQSKDARSIINKVVAHTKKEGKKIEAFLVKELKKEAKKAKPIAKKVINKIKKRIRRK